MKIVKNISLYIIGGLIGFLFLEAFYQAVEITLPYHILDAEIGKKMLASKRVTHFDDGFYLGKINKYGYLGKAYAPNKEPGKTRIAVVGDSYVEGFHLPEQHHFVQILEKKLNTEIAPKFELLNFGIGNYNYNDMFILNENFASEFNCDKVIFLVESKDFKFSDNFIPSPRLELESDTLIIDYSFVNSGIYEVYNRFSPIFSNSAVVKSMNNAYKLIENGSIYGIVLDKFYLPKKESVAATTTEAVKYQLDQRVIKSLDWLDTNNTYFAFKNYIPTYIDTALSNRGFKVFKVDDPLVELAKQGIEYDFWEVTGTRGHWNHQGQIAVASELFRVISEDL